MSPEKRAKYIESAIEQATTAGKKEDRDAVAAILAANGTDARTWFTEINPDAHFLGKKIGPSAGSKAPGVHRELYAVLQKAEAALVKRLGKSAAELGSEFKINAIVGLRPPKRATGRKEAIPSLHCFGLAIDINHPTNPFVGNQKPTKKKNMDKEARAKFEEYMQNRSPRIIERAMWLLKGERFDVEKRLSKAPKGTSAVTHAWKIHQKASDTLAEYLRLADDLNGKRLKDAVDAATARGEPNDLDWWKTRIANDRKMIKPWDFMHHPNPEQRGYMDLPQALVEELVGAGLLWGGMYGGAKDMMHFDLHGKLKRE